MKDKTWNINELSDLEVAVGEVMSLASKVETEKAVVLGLTGDLGAGKTTFTQLLARQLGVSDTVTSPTFVVMKRYQTQNENFKSLVHVDAYRLESVDEMKVLGFADVLAEKGTIICIEWAERIAELLPATTIRLHFNMTAGNRVMELKS